MDAWELLVENSALSSIGYDAWEHLNAQEGGEGTGESWPLLIDSLFIEVDMLSYELNVDIPEFTIDVDSADYEIEVDEIEYTLEVE